MSRSINSSGYRLGITNFWNFQRFVGKSYYPLPILFKSNLCQIVSSLYAFYGYRLFLFSIENNYKNILISTTVLLNYSLEKKKKKYFFSTKKNCFFFVISILKKKINFNFNFNLFLFLFFNFFLFSYQFDLLIKLSICLFIIFNNIFNYLLLFYYILLFNSFFKLNYLHTIKYKIDFYSIYYLKIISKKISFILEKLIKTKKFYIKPKFIYNCFFNISSFKNIKFLNNNFWYIKKNIKFFELLYFSCFFFLSNIIVSIIISNLSRKKKTHLRFIYYFFNLIEFFYFQELLPISGIKIAVTGKINAKMRKQYLSLLLGRLYLSTFISNISFNKLDHETRFGVLGIRVWLSNIVINK